MDPAEAITHVSLCAGYGGIDLGLKRVLPDLRTIAFCEREGYACANLVAKIEAGRLDAAPIWTDLKTYPWDEFRGCVDILSGGYPCQPFSSAGKRLGADDPRHLWPYIADGIARMQPGWVFFENVEGHISLGLENVLRDLQGLGYSGTFGVFSAAEVGAPHQRKRVFILAYRDYPGLEGRFFGFVQECTCQLPPWPSGPSCEQFPWEPPRTVGDTKGQRPAACGAEHAGFFRESCATKSGALDDPRGQEQHGLPESGERHPGIAAGAAGTGVADAQRAEWRKEAGITDVSDRNEGGRDEGPSWSSERGHGQAQPPLGGDANGRSGGLDYAELCLARDNHTDELRLLGNGVVPATAARAFTVLYGRLTGQPGSTPIIRTAPRTHSTAP